MAPRKDCIDEILEIIGNRMKREQVMDHLEDIDNRAEAYQADGMDRGEALRRATEEVLKEESIRNNILKRNAREDALKARNRRTFIDSAVKAGHGSELAIEARLTGTNVPMFDPKSGAGNQLSAAAMGLGAKRDWVGGVVTDLERLSSGPIVGLDKVFYSRTIEDDIFREKWQLDMGDAGKPGITKNDAALKIAEVLYKWDNVRVQALNSEGAWITNYSGYVTKLTHDPDKIRRAATPFRPLDPKSYFQKGFTQADREAWALTVLGHIDVKRTFGGQAAEADKILAEMYGGFVTGDHLEMETVSGEPMFTNIARHVSQERTLHWKSADDWLAYNRAFGRYDNPTDAWLNSVLKSADHYALMKVFGSKPKEGFEEDLVYAKNMAMGKPERLAVDKREQALRNRFAVVSGEADRPIANQWAGIANGVMAVQRLSKLGFTPFAMLQDNVTISRELSRHGLEFLERNGSMLSGYVQGAEGSAKKEIAELLHTGILGRLRGVTARFDISDARAGSMAKLENIFFKWTGITAMTENKRADAERMMAYALGKQRDVEWGALKDDPRRMLEAFGIGEAEWKLLHKVDWHELEGERYLTPDIARQLTDEDIESYMKSKGSIAEQATSSMLLQTAGHTQNLNDRMRQELSLKLWSYFSERGQFAVLEPGAREKAILYQGTQSGSPLNVALRLLLQFKQFPATMITKSWGAEIYGGRNALGRIAGLTELIVGSTFFGILANYLNQTAKGQDAASQWKNQPVQALISGFLRGGAASIYGDFLLGEWSRFGMSALDTLAGPTAGQINSVAELWTDMTHIKKGAATGALAVRMVRSNIPGLNTIYLRMGFDYLVMYRLQEWLNPGYLERMERTMKDKQGIEFLLRPTQVSR